MKWERGRWTENDAKKFHRHVPQLSTAFNEESKAASKEGTWQLSTSVVLKNNFIWDKTLQMCTANPWAEHWPQLILPSSQYCKKLLLVQQCMESPRQLLVDDMLCNLILDSMRYSWNILWEARHRLIAHPFGDPQSLQQHLALKRNTWHFRTGSAVQPHTRPRCWSSFWYHNLHDGSSILSDLCVSDFISRESLLTKGIYSPSPLLVTGRWQLFTMLSPKHQKMNLHYS